MADTRRSDSNLVPVFRTVERGLVPLATMALEEAGIEHVVQHPHLSGVIVGERSDLASAGPADQAPVEVLVAAEDEARARDLLADLAQSGPGTSMPNRADGARPGTVSRQAQAVGDAAGPASPAGAGADAGVVVVDAQTGATIARLTDAQLAWLARHLELESSSDTDYYLDRATIDMLERAGADRALLDTLRGALGPREGVDIRWSPRRA
ncbi:MAG: DUF2007 domain-containing protein [Vicinamibacterales bacterium]